MIRIASSILNGNFHEMRTELCSNVPHTQTELIKPSAFRLQQSLQIIYTNAVTSITFAYQIHQPFLTKTWQDPAKTRKNKGRKRLLRSVCKKKEGACIQIVHLENKTSVSLMLPCKAMSPAVPNLNLPRLWDTQLRYTWGTRDTAPGPSSAGWQQRSWTDMLPRSSMPVSPPPRLSSASHCPSAYRSEPRRPEGTGSIQEGSGFGRRWCAHPEAEHYYSHHQILHLRDLSILYVLPFWCPGIGHKQGDVRRGGTYQQ